MPFSLVIARMLVFNWPYYQLNKRKLMANRYISLHTGEEQKSDVMTFHGNLIYLASDIGFQDILEEQGHKVTRPLAAISTRHIVVEPPLNEAEIQALCDYVEATDPLPDHIHLYDYRQTDQDGKLSRAKAVYRFK